MMHLAGEFEGAGQLNTILKPIIFGNKGFIENISELGKMLIFSIFRGWYNGAE